MSKRRLLATIALGILAAIVAAVLLLHTPPARQYVLEKVEGILASRGIDFRARSFSYNLLELSVTMQDVTVRSRQNPDLPAFVHIPYLDVNLAWADLIGGGIHIQNGAIRNPEIRYVVSEGGRTNLPVSQTPTPGQPTQIPNIRIDQFLISNASLLVEDRVRKFSLSLPEWRFEVTGQPSARGRLQLTLGQEGTVSLQGRALPIRKLELNALLGAGSLDIQQLQLALENSNLNVSGSLQDFSQPKLNLAASGELALQPLTNFAGLQVPASGMVHFTARTSGLLPSLEAQFSAQSEQAGYGQFQNVNLSVQGGYDRAKNRLEVSTLRVQSPFGNVRGQAAMAIGGAGTSSIQAQVERLNLQVVTRAVDLGVRIASTATGSVDLTWPDMNYRKASGRALLNLKKLQPSAARNELPLSGQVLAVIRNGNLTLNIGGGTGSQTSGLLETLRSEMIALLRSIGSLLPASTELPADLSAPQDKPQSDSFTHFRHDTHAPEHLSGRSLQSDVLSRSSTTVRLRRVNFIAPEIRSAGFEGARLNASPRLLQALFFYAQAQGGGGDAQSAHALEVLSTRLRGQVSISAQGRLSGTLRANITDLADFLAQLANFQGQSGSFLPVPVRGATSVTANLGGTLQRPTADITMTAPSISVGQVEDIGLDLRAHYTGQQFVIQQATLTMPQQAQLTVSGSVGLSGRSPSLDLTVQVQSFSIQTALAALQRTGIPASGMVSLNAQINGTVAQPIVQAQVNASGLQAYGEDWGNLALTAALRDNLLRITDLQLDKTPAAPGQTLTAELSYNLQSKAYTLNASAPGLTIRGMQLPGGRTLQAQLEFKAQGSGTVPNPQLQASLVASELTINQQNLGSLNASVQVANQAAQVHVEAPQWGTALTANAGINAPYRGDFHLQTQNLAVNSLPVKLPQVLQQGGLSGTVSLDIQGQGPLAQPEQLNVTGRISELNLTLEGQSITVPSPMAFRYANQVLQVEPSTILAGDSRIEIAGTLPLEANTSPANLHIMGAIDLASAVQFLPAPARSGAPSSGPQRTGQTDQNTTQNEQPGVQGPTGPPGVSPPPQRLTATGQLQLDLNLGGTLRSIVPQGSLTLQNGSFAGPPLPAPVQNFSLQATIASGVAHLQQLAAEFAGGQIRASGDLPLSVLPGSLPIAAPPVNQPASFSASVENINVSQIEGIGDTLSGTVSLALRAQAPRLTLDALDAELTVEKLDLSAGGIPVGQRGNSVIAIRNGLARMEQLIITGPETQLVVAGTAGLTVPRNLDLIVRGQANAALASVLIQDVTIQGIADVQIAVKGSVAEPQMQGFLAMQDGQVLLQTPQVAVSGLRLRLDLGGREVRISQFSADLNGGPLNASGTLRIGAEGFQPDVRLSANGVYMDFPEGLRSISSFELNFVRQDRFYVLGGNVHILEAFYRRDITMPELISAARSSPEVNLTGERSAFLDRLRFNINVDTRNPIVIDNNLARAGIDAALRVVNSYYEPSVVGRVTFQEAGELYLQGNTYYIDRGVITFLNERRIEPSLDILTHTQVAGYDITMRLQGRADDIQTTLTSDPALPEPDIISVLVFGKPLSEVRGQAGTVAQQQAFGLIAGTLGGELSQQLRQATGLSQVAIEPNLIANEATPTARLTVGQQLARGLRLVYSVNLSDAGDQIWLGEYKFTPRLLARITKQQDNSYRFDLRDERRFGNASAPLVGAPVRSRKIASVSFAGNTIFSGEKLADKFGVRAGNTYNFFSVRKGLEKIQSLYPDLGRLEAKVRPDIQESESTVAITIRIDPGPVVRFSFEGWNVPGSVRDSVRDIWTQGVFDQQRAADAISAIKGALVDRGYLENKVTYSINTSTQDEKLVIFDIQPGEHFSNVRTIFPGASAISPDTLSEVLEDSDLKGKLLTQPTDVQTLIRNYYNQQGYLRAEVAMPHPVVEPATRAGSIAIPIDEGPRFRVGDIRFQGAHVFPEDRLRSAVSFQPGEPYDPVLRDRSIVDLQTLYTEHGYLEVNVNYALDLNLENNTITPVFMLDEGQQSIVNNVIITGNDEVTKGLISSQVLFKPGDVLQASGLANSRANLYDTGAFQLVEIEHHPAEAASVNVQPYQKPVDVQVRVVEIQPFQWTYGGYFDTDRGPGGISDFSSRNITGNAQTMGLRLRYDRNRQEGRVYFSQPLLRRFPVKTTASVYYVRNSHFGDNDLLSLIDDETGLSLEQESRFRDYLLTWSYGLERVRIFNRGVADITQSDLPKADVGSLPGEENLPLPPLGASLSQRVAPVVLTMTRETRNDVLNATRGLFLSNSLTTSFRFLGSQQQFVRYFGQYYQYIPLSKPGKVPFSDAKQPRFVYAGALRLGFAGGLGGQSLIQSQRFFAGGGTTIRGFGQDEVGPQIGGVPVGGNSLFILNNELRFPLKWIFDGVGFVDIGNVYSRVADFNPTDVRKAAGFGIRVYTPYILLRADYGIKLDRRTGESFGQLFFSIGQAF